MAQPRQEEPAHHADPLTCPHPPLAEAADPTAMHSPAPPWTLSLHNEMPDDAARVVDEGLGAANLAAAPLHEVQALASLAHDAAGRVLGGAIGRTWGQCCELQQLWVDPAHRGQGLGAALVWAFEARAAERGCRVFYLETFSFQAPRLYAALGYEVRSAIEGFGPGLVKYLMVKGQATEVAHSPAGITSG